MDEPDANLKISLKETVEKLIKLEAERKNLLLDIDELKKMAHEKITATESEVDVAHAKLLKALKSKKNRDKKTIKATIKIEKQRRLSSEEFIRVYDSLWKDGPTVKFPNPDSWERARDNIY
jgi:regulator of replication initiation timing